MSKPIIIHQADSVPPKRPPHRPALYPWLTLEVGQFFIAEFPAKRFKPQVITAQRRYGRSFRVDSEGDNKTRVTRIA